MRSAHGTPRRRIAIVAVAVLATVGLTVPWSVSTAGAADAGSRTRGTSGRAPLATLEIESPDVDVKPAGKSAFVAAKDGRALAAGDTIRTSESGRAQIAYSDGSLTRLDVDTEYKLVKLSAKKGSRKTKGLQTAGQTWHRVEDLTGSESYRVEGANATAAVLGTAFMVNCVARNQCTFTAVVDPIQLTDDTPKGGTKTVTLTPGDQVVVSDDAIGNVAELTQEELLAIKWISENLLADLADGKSTGPSEVGSQTDPPPTRPASTPLQVPPPPDPTATATGPGTSTVIDIDTDTVTDPETGTGTGPGTPVLVNHGPTAFDDAYTMPEDTLLVIAPPGVLANDVDPDGDPLETFLTSLPLHGALDFPGDGTVIYFPDASFNGVDSFTYVAGDGEFGSNEATVTITVNSVNDAPVAVADAYVTDEDTPLVVTAPGVLGNDGDVDSTALAATLVTTPGHGVLAWGGNGSFTYTPDDGFRGGDSFTYRASDGTAQSGVATVSITVNSVDDAPVAVDDAYSTDEDTLLQVGAPGVLGNDSDPDGDQLTADLEGVEVLVEEGDDLHGTLDLSADGSFLYTPDLNYHGTATFAYRATDGVFTSGVATVTITVNPVNDAPEAVDDPYGTFEGTTLEVDAEHGVLSNDSDLEGDELAASVTVEPENGTLTLDADGSFTYAPDEGFSGIDSFKYVANDGTTDSNEATVTITVDTIDLPTLLTSYIHELDPDEAFELLLQATDATAFVIDTLPTGGTLSIGGEPVIAGQDIGLGVLGYTAPSEPGLYTFTWHATNAGGSSAVATEYFLVGSVPVLANGFGYGTEGVPGDVEFPMFTSSLGAPTCYNPGPADGTFATGTFADDTLFVPFTPNSGTNGQVLSWTINAIFGDGCTGPWSQPATGYVAVGYTGDSMPGPEVSVSPDGTIEAASGEAVQFTVTATDPSGLPVDVLFDGFDSDAEVEGPPGTLTLVSHVDDQWTFEWTPDTPASSFNIVHLRAVNLANIETLLSVTINYSPGQSSQ